MRSGNISDVRWLPSEIASDGWQACKAGTVGGLSDSRGHTICAGCTIWEQGIIIL